VDRLRRQPEVTHDGNAGADQGRDHVLVAGHAFELDSLCARAHEGCRRTSAAGTPLRKERKGMSPIRNASAPAPDRGRMPGHHFDGRRQRVGISVHDHRGAVADQQAVDGGRLERACEGGVVAGRHRDLAARRLGGGEFQYRLHGRSLPAVAMRAW
jgi:hypothetical protein